MIEKLRDGCSRTLVSRYLTEGYNAIIIITWGDAFLFSLSLILFSILSRGLTGLPVEHHGKIALVTKTEQRRDLRDRPVAGSQKLFGGLDALPEQIFPHGKTGVGFEQAAQVIRAEAYSLGNILGADLLGQMIG